MKLIGLTRRRETSSMELSLRRQAATITRDRPAEHPLCGSGKITIREIIMPMTGLHFSLGPRLEEEDQVEPHASSLQLHTWEEAAAYQSSHSIMDSLSQLRFKITT
jgi:hypothetical protein